jgi:uncharacterized protein (DUF3084 family)
MTLEEAQTQYEKGLQELAKTYVAKEQADNNLATLKSQLGQLETLIQSLEAQKKTLDLGNEDQVVS